MIPDAAIDALLVVMPAIPVVYLVAQIAALVVMRGALRAVALACALGMGGILLFVLWATVIGGSNIAPILIVFALPPATLAMIVLWVLHLARGRPPDTRYL
jgi:hypothetical protein